MTAVFFNEFHYDNSGADSGEFIEIAGPAGTNLTGWVIVLYNGANNASYATLTLSGTIPDAGAGYGTVAVPALGLQNGAPDGMALVDGTGAVVQFLSYEGTMTAADGPAAGLTSQNVGVSQSGNDPAGLSLQLKGQGSTYEDFVWAANSASSQGGVNGGQTFDAVPPPAVSYSINDASVAEGDTGTTTLTFTVTRSAGSGAITLDWATSNGSATAGSDYLAASGVVSFADGETEAQIAVTVFGDTAAEGNETLTVTLTDPTGTLTLADAAGTGTIRNDDTTLISTVQGNAATQGSNQIGAYDNRDASPLRGQVVTIEAVVVGDFQNGDADSTRNLGGFYLQEEDADSDGDASTSEALFVFDNAFGTDVRVGDLVRVTGTVSEFFGMTQLSSIVSVTVLSSGNTLPTAAAISLGGATSRAQDGGFQADLEAYEGMLVTVPATLTITEQFQLDRFNEITLFDTNGFEQSGPAGTTLVGERPFTYTQFNSPDPAGLQAHLEEVGGRQIVYDDGVNTQNQPIGTLDGFEGYSDATAPSMGDTITNLTGVLDYQWAGNSASQATWRIRSAEEGRNSFVDANPRPDVMAEVAGDIQVASFNVLNFFTSLNVTGSEGVGPGLDQDGRGANSVAEYQRQLEKLATAITGLNAEIVGLVELENDFLAGGSAPGNAGAQGDRGIAIAAIVEALNALAGEDVWAYVDPGTEFVDDDAISGGFIFRQDRVEVADGTAPAILRDADVAPDLLARSTVGGIFDGADTARAPLAVTFQPIGGETEMTVVINHFKSKGGSGTGADADAGDGAGAFNNQRLLAAKALDAWLETEPTGSSTENLLLIGDFNAYASEDPIVFLEDAGFVNVLAEFVEAGYSYLFDAMRGTLDYAFASVSLFNSIVGALEWNINSDEADALDYNLDFGRDPAIFDGTTPYRASDHDPLVVGITFEDKESPLTVSTYTGPSFDASIDPTGALSVNHLASIDLDGAEIAAYAEGKVYVTSSTGLTIVDISDPAAPVFVDKLNFTEAPFGLASTDITSVASNGSLLAVALPATDKTLPGTLLVLDLDGNPIASYATGPNPDSVTFSPDGRTILVANEGEPSNLATFNPAGSVTVIDLAAGTATQVDFSAFNGKEDALREAGVRIFEGQSAAADFEPEYIAVSKDGLTAMVTLQEANAIAVLDLTTKTFDRIIPLGGKDFSSLLADFSDRDSPTGGASIKLETGNPVIGQFMPDAISSYTGADGKTYYVIANEGDDRDDFMSPDETTRVSSSSYDLDNAAFPNETALKANGELGRLTVSTSPLLNGDTDGDGDVDQILTYGGRSFSILDETGRMVFDSGDAIERIIATRFPTLWDDGRSDNKGPEPEGVTVGMVGGRAYAFVGLERSNTTLVFDVTDPADVSFVTAAGQTGDVSPEGTLFVPASDSPTGEALYIVANEVSGTLGLYGVAPKPAPNFTLELLHFSDQEASTSALVNAPNLSAVLNGLRQQDVGGDGIADNTLTLSSGDVFIGSPFFDASGPVFGSRGIADIQIQNELGVQAVAFGNHEFDFGTPVIAGLISGSAPGSILGQDFRGADFPYLSANLDFSRNANLAPLEVAGGQAPLARTVTSSIVLTVDSQQTGTTELVGVVGATTPTLGRISSPGTVGISPAPFDNVPTPAQLDALAAIIQSEVDALLAANPGMNKVILMAHMQVLDIEIALAGRLSGVDIIMAGGSNTRLFDDNDRPRNGDSDQGQYPIFTTDKDGNPIAIVNTDGSYKYVGRLVIDFDENGHIITDSYDADVSGAYATDAAGVAAVGGTPDAEIVEIVEAIEAQIVSTQSNVFGYSDVFLNGNRTGTATGTDPDGVRSQETNLGNLTARANLAYAQDFDSSVMVSIKNGGGIRASIGEVTVPPGGTAPVRLPNSELLDGDGNVIKPAGAISQTDISTALAFNNGLSLVSMTATELVAILNHAANSAGAGGFGQFAGVEYSFDPSRPAGSRVTQADIVDENGASIIALVRGGVTVADPGLVIRAVTLNFLIPNGDGYPFSLSNPQRVDLYDLDRNAVADGDRSGGATFADTGTEQDAFAEYLLENHGTPEDAFDEADVGRDSDLGITNLGFARQEIQIDTRGRSWSQITETFDGAGVLREQVTDFDNGKIVTSAFDSAGRIVTRTEADAGDVAGYAKETRYFDGSGAVVRIEQVRDDGSVETEIFSNGIIQSREIADPTDVFDYVTNTTLYDAAGERAEIETVFDNGDVRIRSYVDGELDVTRTIRATDGGQNILGSGLGNRIAGGTGDDVMTGRGGADTFVFAASGFGRDRVSDLDLSEGDRLDLTGLGIDDLSDLLAAATVSQQGRNVLIDFGNDEILLSRVDVSDLTDAAFVGLLVT